MARERYINGLLIRENLDGSIELIDKPDEANERVYYVITDADGNIYRMLELTKNKGEHQDNLSDFKMHGKNMHMYEINIIEFFEMTEKMVDAAINATEAKPFKRVQDLKFKERKIHSIIRNGNIEKQ